MWRIGERSDHAVLWWVRHAAGECAVCAASAVGVGWEWRRHSHAVAGSGAV